MTRPPQASDQGGFRAQWAGICHLCDQPFPANTPIVKVRGHAVHVRCYQAAHE